MCNFVERWNASLITRSISVYFTLIILVFDFAWNVKCNNYRSWFRITCEINIGHRKKPRSVLEIKYFIIFIHFEMLTSFLFFNTDETDNFSQKVCTLFLQLQLWIKTKEF